ncbi:uncharacterized protein LOC119651354 isoform X2 [Hermetia illucens]|uniref:uncharacterized protein LOC119651354 isoform X2 n=1 Tax=Hermetia illucens TaxID=343691 RepID=UPI0018CC5748|nr:uncharacterized protein LOC119651354 isoform X2 [Hermetia illucens]
MQCTIFLIIMSVRLVTGASGVPILVNFLNELKEVYHPLQIVAYTCFDSDEKKYFAENFNSMLKFNSLEAVSSLVKDEDAPHLTTYLLDLQCNNSKAFMEASETRKFFQHPYRWVIFGSVLSQVPEIETLIDSNVLFVEKNFQLWNFYRVRPSLPYIFEYFGHWDETGLQINHTSMVLSRRRRNLQKIPLKVTIVITQNQSMDHLEDYQERHIDSIGKVNFAVTKVLLESLNASSIYNRVNTWGYLNQSTGNWTGMMEELVNGRSDIGGTSLFFQTNRIPLIDYLSMVTPTRSAFLFRAPPLSTVSNIYLLPFTNLVWLTTGFIVVLAVIFIFTILMVQTKFVNFEGPENSSRFSDCILIGISAISQMGIILQPRRMSLRIASIFLLVALLFLYTSYTANIVALLQSTARTITSLTDLLNSNLEVALDDNPYNRYYFPMATEPIRRKIYETKVLTAKGGSYINVSDGVERLRRESFAFHTELSVSYNLIERTFYEHEKCNLQTVEFLQVIDPWYAIRKNSSFKELIKFISYSRIWNSSKRKRENLHEATAMHVSWTKLCQCTIAGMLWSIRYIGLWVCNFFFIFRHGKTIG